MQIESMSRREFLKLGGAVAAALAENMLPRGRWVDYFYRGDPDSNKFAITIDDGWDLELVYKTLNMLDKHHVRASLFPVGVMISKDLELWKQAIKSGFELHNHTYRHENLGDLSKQKIGRQLTMWEDQYAGLGFGEYTRKLIRAPGNEGVNNPDLYNAAEKLGYKAVVGWTADSRAATSSDATPQRVFEQVKDGIVGGGVVLLHFVPADISAIPQIIEYAREKGLAPVKLSSLPGSPIYKKTFSTNRKRLRSLAK